MYSDSTPYLCDLSKSTFRDDLSSSGFSTVQNHSGVSHETSEDVEVSEEREHGVRERARVTLRGRVDHEGRTRPVAPPVVVQQRDGRRHPPHAERRTHRLAHVVDALLEDVLRADDALRPHLAGLPLAQHVGDGAEVDVRSSGATPARLHALVHDGAAEHVAAVTGVVAHRRQQRRPRVVPVRHEILVEVLEDGERRHAHRAQQTVLDRPRLAVVPDVQRTDVRAERPRNDGDDPIALVVRQQRAHRGARRVVVEDEVIGAEQPRQLHELDDVHLVNVSEERWHADGEVVAVSSP